MDIQLPDGTMVHDVPDGMSKADLTAKLVANGYDATLLNSPSVKSAEVANKDYTEPNPFGVAKNIGLGAVKGVSQIGSTLLAPYDWLTGNTARRADVTSALTDQFGANPSSLPFQVGQLGAEVAGTAGAGSVLGAGVSALGAARLGSAIGSGGFSLGTPAATTFMGNVGNAVTRIGGGAINGALNAGLVNPEAAGAGALIGGALPAAGGTLGFIASNVKNAAMPMLMPQRYVANQLNSALGSEAPTVISNLDNATFLVPGSLPTSAQVAGTLPLVNAERSVQSNPGFAERNVANNAARWNALRSVAKTPAELDAADAVRQVEAQRLYGKAFTTPIDPATLTPAVQDDIAALMSRPDMQDAMDIARRRAANKNLNMSDATSIQGLHMAKEALGDMIGSAKVSNKSHAAEDLVDTQKKLVDVIERLSAPYLAARPAYAAASIPVNTMEAGQSIVDSLSRASQDASHNPVITLPNYRTAFDRASKAAEFGIEPGAAQTLGNIGTDLQNATVSHGSGKISSPIQPQGALAKFIYGPNFEGTGKLGQLTGAAVGSMVPHLGTLGGWLGMKALGSGTGGKLNASLADLMLNPSKLSEALKASQQSGPLQRFGQAMSSPGIRAAAVAAPEDYSAQQDTRH